MNKAFVQIRDTGSVFYDGYTGTTVSGAEPVEIELTEKVVQAIKGGALRKLDEKEAKAILKQLKTQDELNDNSDVDKDDTSIGGSPIDYTIFTVSELKDKLEDRNIDHDKTLKADLVSLLVEDDKVNNY